MDSRSKRLSCAHRLVAAIESGDRQEEREAADAVARQHSLLLHEELHEELHRIAAELRDALCNVHVAGELARLAHRELPEAQLRLNQVIGLTEDAAHRTLAAVEASLPLADGMAEAVIRFKSTQAQAGIEGTERPLAELLDRIVADSTQLKSCLSEVMMAQSFQDLTGQIIRRVVGLVAELESILGHPRADEPGLSMERSRLRRGAVDNAGYGPALPGPRADIVDGQQDVDDLLSELGV